MKLIAAVTKDYGVGYKNGLLFKFKEDMKWFKEKTIGKTCIMGYNTFMSLPVDPTDKVILPNRKKVVLCHHHQALSAFARGADDVILKLTEGIVDQYKDAYVIGGPVCWKLFAPYIDTLYLTHILSNAEAADAFFPAELFELDNENKWRKEVKWKSEQNGIKMICKKYELS